MANFHEYTDFHHLVKFEEFVKITTDRAQESLEKILAGHRVLRLTDIDTQVRPVSEEGPLADLLVTLDTIDGTRRLAVEVLSNGEPRSIRVALATLPELRRAYPDARPMLVAPYLSAASSELCQQAGVSYSDLAGNFHLDLGNIVLHYEGYPNPFTKKRPLTRLFTPTNERLMRVLLDDPKRTWTTQELAAAAHISLGQVSKVKDRLVEQEWMDATRGKIALLRPEKLLLDWRKAYDYSRSTITNCYTMTPLPEIERLLLEHAARQGRRCALASFSAAARIAPHVKHNRAVAYFEGDPASLASSLTLKEVSSGANVQILTPYDEGVFLGSQVREGLAVTSPIQTYLDLNSQKGRGEEAAQFLLEHEIRPSW